MANKMMQKHYGYEFTDPDTIDALEKIRSVPLK